MEFAQILRQVRERSPLVQCITNFVTVNDCANIILASGGSPTMASHISEVEEAVCNVQALVCNLGAIDKVDSMILAGKQANRLGKPVILDPVGAGGTRLRRDMVKRLLEEVHVTVIRGNASEIRYLAGQRSGGSGVDVSRLDEITEENLADAVSMAAELAKNLHSVIAISGRIDVITDGARICVLRNGCAAMGVCGELADRQRLRKGTGNATFRNDLIDAVFNLTEEQLKQGVRYEIYKR